MKAQHIIKHSLIINGKKTSISVEGLFWDLFRAEADERGCSISKLASELRNAHTGCNLSSLIRQFCMTQVKLRYEATLTGHS